MSAQIENRIILKSVPWIHTNMTKSVLMIRAFSNFGNFKLSRN